MIEEARRLSTEGKHKEALELALAVLDKDFDNPAALYIAGFCMQQTENPGLAYQLFKRACDYPNAADFDRSMTWQALGTCFYDKRKLDEAEECYRKALRYDANNANACASLGMIAVAKSEYGMAIEWSNKALKIEPDHEDAKINRGFAYLALGKYGEGWDGYNLNIGKITDRTDRFPNVKRWNGEKDQTVIVYREQGLGDEISFASCIPDAIKDCKKVILDCDPRLSDLWKRSFPEAVVIARGYESYEVEADYKIGIGELPGIYRRDVKDFPGAPYIHACPEKSLQWRALLDSLGDKPKIGIAWTGGREHTYRSRRSVSLETLLPILRYDAHWISLQYQGIPDFPAFEEKTGVRIHHWPWGVEAKYVDQTAALISQLDLVISVTTGVVHIAGGLGKETWCLVPDKCLWRYGTKGEDFPWAKSVKLYRQKGREWPVHTLYSQLKERFG